MTCKVIACLSTGGQGVKPLVQCWPAGSPRASGSLWESLCSPQGSGLWPLLLSLLFLEHSLSHLPTGLWHTPAGRLYSLHAPIPAQWMTDTEHLPFDCRREPATICTEEVVTWPQETGWAYSLRAGPPGMNFCMPSTLDTCPHPLHCHSHSAGTKAKLLAVLPLQSLLFNKSIPWAAYS